LIVAKREKEHAAFLEAAEEKRKKEAELRELERIQKA